MITTLPSAEVLTWAAEAAGGPMLRRFPPGDTAAANEAHVLDVLDGLDGWAPRLLGADPDGARSGEPAVLISRLPGRADITTIAPETAAAQQGRGAAPGRSLLKAHGHRLTGAEYVLTHYDFWAGNVLWQGDTLTGVVDWSGASLAPRGFDVGWCRLDLVLLDVFAVPDSHHAVEGWLPNHHDLGRTDLTPRDLRDRHTAWTEERLGRRRP